MTDDSEIHDLVLGFISAMNKWEIACKANSRKERKGLLDMEETDKIDMDALVEVYKKYCLEWEKPKRGVTWRDPPSYDPDCCTIRKIESSKDSVVVEVLYESDFFMDGITQYFAQERDGAWRLEDRRRHLDLEGNVVQEWNTL
ncbi:NTF2 fold immunity protein [Planctomycetota bacterium]|nr:NTF2 fold immunity protein [Planctomycetota bacterium]